MIVDEYVEPAVLTGFVREVPTPSGLFLNRFLPDRNIGNVEAAIEQMTKTNRVAQFRSWDTETPIAERDTFRRSKVKLPPLGNKLPIGEEETLMLERARTGGDNRNAYVEAIYNDAERLTQYVHNRMELARADVLVDGSFKLVGENGLWIEADFGVPSGNLVTAATVWSDHTNATPLQEYGAWVNHYVDVNGEKPGWAVTSTTVVNNMLLSDEIRALFYRGDSIGGTGPNLITPAQLNQVFQAYGYPPIVTYDTRLNVNGTDQRAIPQDRFILLPSDPASLGYTAWGICAEALQLGTGQNPSLSFEQLPGLCGVTLLEGDPVRRWTKVTAVGMPILTNPNRLMVADVLTS